MEYQKVIISLDNMSNQLFKSRTKNWIEITVNQEECIIPIVILDLRPQR